MATRYRLGETIERMSETPTKPRDAKTPPSPYVEVIEHSESGMLGVEDPDARRALAGLAASHATFVESYASCFIGSVALPHHGKANRHLRRFGFYLDAARLVLLDIDSPCTVAMDELSQIELAPNPTPARALYELLRHLLKDDLQHLMENEDGLARIEDRIIEGERDEENPSGHIMRRRRALMRLAGFYQQLEELARDIAQDDCGLLARAERRAFATLGQQAERLGHKAQYLRDYCMQLLELQQAQSARRRDSTNLYLTIVASIFVPITTITGWYGMNFSNMPELSWEYGYATVIVLSLLIIAGELAYFRHRKWL